MAWRGNSKDEQPNNPAGSNEVMGTERRTLMGLVQTVGHLLVRPDDGTCPTGLQRKFAFIHISETEAAQRALEMKTRTAAKRRQMRFVNNSASEIKCTGRGGAAYHSDQRHCG